jgi:GNAT superfamily N-acetyltransferase
MSDAKIVDGRGVQTKTELRPGRAADAEVLGRICYQAFADVATEHGFPPVIPDPETATDVMTELISHPGSYSIVAERAGRIVGSNFLDERSSISGVGPITVDPAVQSAGIGRLLMQDILDHAAERGFAGVRLLQFAYNTRSLGLYSKMGFQVRDMVACMQGPAISAQIPGYQVRAATEADLEACNRVCLEVHGHHRGGELLDAITHGGAVVVEHGGRITGYATSIGFLGHAVGETTEAIKALIGAAQAFEGPGILVPVRNSALFQWCLQNRLRVEYVLTLMSIGLYNEPAGAFLPSILF